MEQREIEIFLTLAEELHFGHTAERLHVSTTRVSQTIRKVERQIGVPLFERTSRRAVLTPIGRHLEEGLRPAFEQTREVIARAIAAGRGVDGELVVGFVGTVVGRFLRSVGEVFQARHPACQIQIREARYSDFLGLLRSGELDLALVRSRSRTQTWSRVRSCSPSRRCWPSRPGIPSPGGRRSRWRIWPATRCCIRRPFPNT